jgi:hypothetical protein
LEALAGRGVGVADGRAAEASDVADGTVKSTAGGDELGCGATACSGVLTGAAGAPSEGRATCSEPDPGFANATRSAVPAGTTAMERTWSATSGETVKVNMSPAVLISPLAECEQSHCGAAVIGPP